MPKKNETSDVAALDLGLLGIFDALLAEGSVTRASRRRGLTQPAVSKALSRLRRVFGDPLFVRTRTGLVPTSRALQLHDPVRRLLADAQTLVNQEGELDPRTERGTFHVAMSDALSVVLLPGLFRKLQVVAPAVSLRVSPLPEDTEKALVGRAVDLCIRPTLPTLHGVYRKVLYRDGFSCMVRKDHPLARTGISFDAYCQASHIFVTLGEPSSRSPVAEALRALGVERHVALTVPSFLVAGILASTTDLIYTAPACLARALAGRSPFTLLEPPFPVKPVEVAMLWHESRDPEVRLRWLRGLFSEVVAEI